MDLTGYGYRRAKQSQAAGNGTQGRFDSPVKELSQELTDGAMRLMARLETKVVLREVPAKFPRVLNQLAAVWDKPAEANRCFEALLFDARRTRQGSRHRSRAKSLHFGFSYITRVFPQKTDPWDQTLLR